MRMINKDNKRQKIPNTRRIGPRRGAGVMVARGRGSGVADFAGGRGVV